MIAIPNMSKPKMYGECPLFIDRCYFDGNEWHNGCFSLKEEVFDDEVHPSCPLIEIIPCKECKYSHMTYGGECKYCDWEKDDDDNYIECYFDGDHFCGYGERIEE